MLFMQMTNAVLEDEVEGTSWKLWIPESLTAVLIQRARTEETAAHGGMGKTLHALRRQFYWPAMREASAADVVNFLAYEG
ncbi:hypothetical protein ACLKA6_008504 [Drosophila palustris]